jgi:hypothetical protein
MLSACLSATRSWNRGCSRQKCFLLLLSTTWLGRALAVPISDLITTKVKGPILCYKCCRSHRPWFGPLLLLYVHQQFLFRQSATAKKSMLRPVHPVNPVFASCAGGSGRHADASAAEEGEEEVVDARAAAECTAECRACGRRGARRAADGGAGALVAWLRFDGSAGPSAACNITETNRIHVVIFGIQNRTFGSWLAGLAPALLAMVPGILARSPWHLSVRALFFWGGGSSTGGAGLSVLRPGWGVIVRLGFDGTLRV